MPISEFCRREVICATKETAVTEAAILMRRHHIGDVIVVEQREGRQIPVGIVTDRDIVVEVIAAGLDPHTIALGDLALAPLVTIGEDAGYAETVRLMSIKGVRRMPVVGKTGELVGIITLDDMLWQLASPLAALSSLSGRERQFETLTRR